MVVSDPMDGSTSAGTIDSRFLSVVGHCKKRKVLCAKNSEMPIFVVFSLFRH
jgi:hypothetical protein